MAESVDMSERWRVLVVGNNPIDLSFIFERLQAISGRNVLCETAFDLTSALQRLDGFRPEHILIDDNVGQSAMQAMVIELQKGWMRTVPITVLKNSNYQQSIARGVMNYVLKQNLSSEHLYRELLNSIHFLKIQLSLERFYRKRRGALKRLFVSAD